MGFANFFQKDQRIFIPSYNPTEMSIFKTTAFNPLQMDLVEL